MGRHVYKIVEIVGTSEARSEEAIQNGIAPAAESLRSIGWFEVVQPRGHVSEGRGHE